MITIHRAIGFERKRADALVRRVYTLQGLGDHGLPDVGDTFIVCDGFHMAGTLSLVVDTSAGLPADDLFQDELDRLRADGARLCEVSRFALETQLPSAKIFHDLFGAIHRHTERYYDCTDVIIQADPPHALFYRRRLGFKLVGQPATNPTYNAPAQLMRIRLRDLRKVLARPDKDHPVHDQAQHRPLRAA